MHTSCLSHMNLLLDQKTPEVVLVFELRECLECLTDLCHTPHPQQMTPTPLLAPEWPHLPHTRSTLSRAPAAQWGSTRGPEHTDILAS